jgi:hypothetical protein
MMKNKVELDRTSPDRTGLDRIGSFISVVSNWTK